MTFSELEISIRADLFRHDGRTGGWWLLRSLWGWPGFRYVFLMRVCRFLRTRPILRFICYPPALLLYVRTGRRYGIRVPLSCQVGIGLYIAHWGGIWVNPGVSIGQNCVLGHEVTLGHLSRGPTSGVPEIGDNVYLGPGSKVLGKVRVGHHALISANSLVLQDVPDKGVMIGVPARLFSQTGSEGYVTWTVSDLSTEIKKTAADT